MAFYAYENISDDVLNKQHTTSSGEQYTLRHNENLKVEMAYLGKGHYKANSQGWERNNSKYFNTLYKNHPEMFSQKNVLRIKNGNAPIVDQKMISYNPSWVQYRNQPLYHHHIGGDGEAVAIPKNAHKGQGEIHNIEKAAGITDKCKAFSKQCEQNKDSFGKTISQLHDKNLQIQNHNNQSEKQSQNSDILNKQNSRSTGNAINNEMSSRSSAVRNVTSTSSTAIPESRSNDVKNVSSRTSSITTERSASVQNVSVNNTNSDNLGYISTQSRSSSSTGNTSTALSGNSSSNSNSSSSPSNGQGNSSSGETGNSSGGESGNGQGK